MLPTSQRRRGRPATACAAGLALALLAGPACGAGVYKWTDEDGKVHFGDRPPAEGAESVEVDEAPPSADVPSTEERRERTRRLLRSYEYERAEKRAQKEKDQERKRKLQRACARLKDHIRTLERANLVYRLDESGERVYADDASRAARMDELNRKYAESCSG